MASILPTGNVRPLRSVKAPLATVNGRKPSLMRRILDFLSAWDQKQKDREIERMLACSGGRFNDEIERRILEREIATDWSIRR